MLDGQSISAVLIGLAGLIAYLVSQTSAKGKALRHEVRDLRRRDIAHTKWAHRVELDYADRGCEMPRLPKELLKIGDDEEW